MDLNDILFGTERDRVARASSSTYSPQELARLGLKITLNLSNQRTRYVGSPPVYPELVVWRPDNPYTETGQAVIVEEVETSGSLTQPRINDWRILSSLLGVRFNLIVPSSSLTQIRSILNTNQLNITNIHLQTYHLDAQNRFVFTNIT